MTTKPLAVFSTRDLKLATILDHLGWEFENNNAPASRIKRDSGEESTVFHFLANHPDTGEQANTVMRVFVDAKEEIEKIRAEVSGQENATTASQARWQAFKAKHPGQVPDLVSLLQTRDTLVSVVKATPRQLVFERNGKIVSISENATEADKKRFAKFL
jgi:hypothetical protein